MMACKCFIVISIFIVFFFLPLSILRRESPELEPVFGWYLLVGCENMAEQTKKPVQSMIVFQEHRENIADSG